MLEIFEFYGWLFKAILVGLGFLILLILAIFIVVGAGYAIYGVGYVAFYAVGCVLGFLGLGSPILVPLFIYLASIYESLWFPRLAAISAILGLFIWFALIYSHYLEKEDKAKKDRIARIESSVLQRLREDFVRKTSSFSA